MKFPCATHLVVLSKGPVDAIQVKVQAILQEMGLALKMEKTRTVKAEEGFDFLGFRCVRRNSREVGKRITLIFPTQKAEKRARETIRSLVGPQMLHVKPAKVIERLNQFLRGWTSYYKHTNAAYAFQELQDYCNQKVRRYLQRRKARKGFGYTRYPNNFLFDILKLEYIARGRLERVWS